MPARAPSPTSPEAPFRHLTGKGGKEGSTQSHHLARVLFVVLALDAGWVVIEDRRGPIADGNAVDGAVQPETDDQVPAGGQGRKPAAVGHLPHKILGGALPGEPTRDVRPFATQVVPIDDNDQPIGVVAGQLLEQRAHGQRSAHLEQDERPATGSNKGLRPDRWFVAEAVPGIVQDDKVRKRVVAAEFQRLQSTTVRPGVAAVVLDAPHLVPAVAVSGDGKASKPNVGVKHVSGRNSLQVEDLGSGHCGHARSPQEAGQ